MRIFNVLELLYYFYNCCKDLKNKLLLHNISVNLNMSYELFKCSVINCIADYTVFISYYNKICIF